MKIISFAAMKGGTGKTTCCFNFAGELAKNHKVLVLDFDAQCNLSSNFGFDIFSDKADVKTVADIFESISTDPFDILIPSPIKDLPNLDLFPSTMYLYGTELLVSTRPMRELIMKNYIERNLDFFSMYDYILFDTGPNMGLINQNAFFASDNILLILDPDPNSAGGAKVFLKLWSDFRENCQIADTVNGLIVNNVEYPHTNAYKDFTECIAENEKLSSIRFKSEIIHTTRFRDTTGKHIPLCLLKTRTQSEKASKDKAIMSINNLLEELRKEGIL